MLGTKRNRYNSIWKYNIANYFLDNRNLYKGIKHYFILLKETLGGIVDGRSKTIFRRNSKWKKWI